MRSVLLALAVASCGTAMSSECRTAVRACHERCPEPSARERGMLHENRRHEPERSGVVVSSGPLIDEPVGGATECEMRCVPTIVCGAPR